MVKAVEAMSRQLGTGRPRRAAPAPAGPMRFIWENNSCYLNSALQMLPAMPGVMEALEEAEEAGLLGLTAQAILNAWRERRTPRDSTAVRRALAWERPEQEADLMGGRLGDPNSVLQTLFATEASPRDIAEGWAPLLPPSVTGRVRQFHTRQEVRCLTCPDDSELLWYESGPPMAFATLELAVMKEDSTWAELVAVCGSAENPAVKETQAGARHCIKGCVDTEVGVGTPHAGRNHSWLDEAAPGKDLILVEIPVVLFGEQPIRDSRVIRAHDGFPIQGRQHKVLAATDMVSEDHYVAFTARDSGQGFNHIDDVQEKSRRAGCTFKDQLPDNLRRLTMLVLAPIAAQSPVPASDRVVQAQTDSVSDIPHEVQPAGDAPVVGDVSLAPPAAVPTSGDVDGVLEVVMDFSGYVRESGCGWTAAFDARSRSVKFKNVNHNSAAYASGLRKGDVLAWVESPDAEPLSRTKDDKKRLDDYAKACLHSSAVLRIGIARSSGKSSRPTSRDRKAEKEQHRLAQQRHFSSRTPEQVQARQEADAARKSQTRASETPEQIQARQEADAARKSQTRASETPEQIQARQEADAARKSQTRASETPEQIQARQEADAARKSQTRASETPEQIQARQEADAARKSQARDSETPEETQARLEAIAALMSQTRASETPEQIQARQEADAARKSQARDSETPARRSTRRRRDRDSHQLRRLEATDEEKEEMRRKDRLRKAQAKEALSAEEHLAFLEDQCAYLRKWRQRQRGSDEGKARLETYKAYWRRYWDGLSDEERAVKRDADKEAKATARANQDDVAKQVAAYRRYAARKKKMALETKEERLARLHAEDIKKVKREILKGLQVSDPQGLADHMKIQRLERAKRAGLQAIKKNIMYWGHGRLEPFTEEEIRQNEEQKRDYFHGMIADAPTHGCISCRQLFFSRQMNKFTPKSLNKLGQKEELVARRIAAARKSETPTNSEKIRQSIVLLDTFNIALKEIREAYEDIKKKAVDEPLLWGHPEKPSVRICHRCWGVLKNAEAPRMGSWNQMKPADVPPALASLNELEAQLVSLRRPFMKLASLPRGGQKGVVGGVINVPADVQQTMARLLPLNLEEGQLVTVELKKKLVYKSVDLKRLVCPSRMVDALVELKVVNPHYAEVEIKNPAAWEAEVAEENPEFADHLVAPAGEAVPDPVDPSLPPSLRPDTGDPEDAEDDDEEAEEEMELGDDGLPLPIPSIVDSAILPVEGARVGDINVIARQMNKGKKKKAVQLAPSEGHRPLPFFLDPAVEELAFVILFPDAKNCYRTERLIPVTLGEYLKNRLTLSDRRFVSSHPYIFFSLFRLEYERLLSSISISLNKVTLENKLGQNLSEVDFKNDEFVEQFIASDGGYRWMQQSRGSPAYWKKALLDLNAMCRQLGPPTLFLTLSADDRHWHDVIAPMYELEYKKSPSVEELDSLSERQRNHLLRKYPDVAARLFHNRVNTLFEKVLANGDVSPFKYPLEDFFYRFEWQQRGSPHIHSLLWLDGAPVLGQDPEGEFIELAESLIRTDIPDKDKDPELYHLVTTKQIHRHTASCQKLKKPRFKISAKEAAAMTPLELKRKKEDAHCRFNFERKSCEATALHHDLPRITERGQPPKAASAQPLASQSGGQAPRSQPAGSQLAIIAAEAALPDDASMRSDRTQSTESLHSALEEPPMPPTPTSLRRIRSLQQEKAAQMKQLWDVGGEEEDELSDSFLANLSLDGGPDDPPAKPSAPNYQREMQSANVQLEMRRAKGEGYVNNWNSALLRLWCANIDVQMVTNFHAAAQYMCSYIAKSEKELGETMTEVLRSIPDGTAPIQRLRKVANAFMNARSVSAQEAIHRILGLSMLMKSREVKALSTGFIRNRHRMLKSRAERAKLDKMTARANDLFVPGPVDKYCQRDISDKEVLHMSFAVFCAWYEGNGARGGDREEDGEAEGGCADLEAPPAEDSDRDASPPPDRPSAPATPTSPPAKSPRLRSTPQKTPTKSQRQATAAPPPSSPPASQPQDGDDLPDTIELLSEDKHVLDKLQKRRRKRVLRFYNFTREEQKEEGAYSKLVLFVPFSDEVRDLSLANSPYDTYVAWQEAESELIEKGLDEFDPYGEMMSKAMEEMSKEKRDAMERQMGGAEDDGGGSDAGDAEDDDMDALLDPDNLQLDVLDGIAPTDEDAAAPANPFTVRSCFTGSTKEELVSQLQAIEAKMNKDQRFAYQAAIKAIETYKQDQAAGRRYKGKPLFFSGPGGTGKSFLLGAIRMKIHLELAEDLQDVTSMVLAPTGCAAINVEGDTIHHGLSIPIQQGFATIDRGLSAKKLQTLKNTYEKTHAFLIDEVSMVGSNVIYQVDGRLRSITGTVEPDVHFGGLLIFWFGDLRQIPPVKAPRPYANPKVNVVGAAAAGIHLWRDQTLLYELTIIERQKGDQEFAQLLNRLREGLHNDEDLRTLNSRVIGSPGLENALEDPEVRDALHLYPTNDQVGTQNSDRLQKLLGGAQAAARAKGEDPDSPGVHLLVHAHDDFSKNSLQTKASYRGNFEDLLPDTLDKTGGLPSQLHLVKDLRVMLRANVGVGDGLVNGSCGNVVHWSKDGKVAFVRFDKFRGQLVGQDERKKLSRFLRGETLTKDLSIIPIVQREQTFSAKSGGHQITRRMLPLVMTYASTIHKAQGMSLERVVVDLSPPKIGPDGKKKGPEIKPSMAYVALSRVTSLKGLYLLGFAASSIKADAAAGLEYDRLKKFFIEDHGKNCDCPKDGPCWVVAAVLAKDALEERTAPAKACGSSSHGKQRTTGQKISRTVRKLLVPGTAQQRVEKKAGHVSGESLLHLLRSDTFNDAAHRLVAAFSGTQRQFSKTFFCSTKVKELRALLSVHAQDISMMLDELRGAKLVPLECKARAAQTDQAATNLLYTCLHALLRPVSVPKDGNSKYNAFAALCVGRGDTGLHQILRALSLVFVLAFPDHIKALIDAELEGLSPQALDAKYAEICWDIFRLKSGNEKMALYAASWILGRPVHVYTPCFEWDEGSASFDLTKPKGGAELDRDLGNLKEAFAESSSHDSPLPVWTEYSAMLPSFHPNRLPACIFLHLNHFSPIFVRRGTKKNQLVQPAFQSWERELPQIRQQHPIPQTVDEVRAHPAFSAQPGPAQLPVSAKLPAPTKPAAPAKRPVRAHLPAPVQLPALAPNQGTQPIIPAALGHLQEGSSDGYDYRSSSERLFRNAAAREEQRKRVLKSLRRRSATPSRPSGTVLPHHLPTWTAYARQHNLTSSPGETVRPELNNLIRIFDGGDVTKLGVDAVVNAAKESCLGGGGVDGAIHRAAGPELLEECRLLDGCTTGHAKATFAHGLPASYVFHAVGPVGLHPAQLQQTYDAVLALAAQLQVKTLGLVSISTGIYGYPAGPAAELVARTLRRALAAGRADGGFDAVVLCLFSHQDRQAFRAALLKHFPITKSVPDTTRAPTAQPPAPALSLEKLLKAMPKQVQSVSKWLLKEFQHAKRTSITVFEEESPEYKAFPTSEDQMRLAELGKKRRGDVAALVLYIRRNFAPQHFREGEFVVVESVTGRLYKGLHDALKPIDTTGDGNCWMRALSIGLLGGDGLHQLLRALITYTMVAAEPYFMPFFLFNSGKTVVDYVREIFRAYYLDEYAGNIHQIVSSLILARDVHIFLERKKNRTVLLDGAKVDPEELTLAQLHSHYAHKAGGLVGHVVVPGASVLLHRNNRLALRVFHREPHFTAILPNTDNDNIPVPFQPIFQETAETRAAVPDFLRPDGF